jgi:hypothetical protein
MPLTSWKTTTIAGTFVRFSFKVPVPWPPVVGAHALQVMSVSVMLPVVHPIVILPGRTCVVDPGPQDNTAGTGVAVVVVAKEEVVVDPCAVVVEAWPAVDLAGGVEESGPRVNPMPIPTPRAATTRATIPARTRVLRRTVMVIGEFLAGTNVTVVRSVSSKSQRTSVAARDRPVGGRDRQAPACRCGAQGTTVSITLDGSGSVGTQWLPWGCVRHAGGTHGPRAR